MGKNLYELMKEYIKVQKGIELLLGEACGGSKREGLEKELSVMIGKEMEGAAGIGRKV